MKEILPDVYWLDCGSSNLYLLIEEENLALIDTGVPNRQALVLDAIRQIGRWPDDLKHILVTHADWDHAGSLAAIQAETGATVHAGSETAALLTNGRSPKHLPRPIQFIMNAFVRYKPIPEKIIQTCQEGDELPLLGGLQVIATPGHTLDHHSFFSASAGILFAGDALNTRQDRINPTPPRITADQEAAMRSAIRLLQLAPAVIACGHGRPSTTHTSNDLMALFNALRRE